MENTFPTLSTQDIVQCLSDFNVHFTVEQISHPTAETVRAIFVESIQFLMGVSQEALSQPLFSAMHVFEFPQLHEEAVSEMALVRYIMRLMRTIGVEDFTLRDLVLPEPSRLHHQISALVNFVKFREERLTQLDAVAGDTGVLTDKKQRLTEDLQENLVKVQQVKATRLREEPEVQQLAAKSEALVSEMFELNTAHQTLKADVAATQELAKGLADRLVNEQFAASNAERECQVLQAQLVRSPERVRQKGLELEKNEKLEKADLEEKELALHEHQARLRHLTKAEHQTARSLALARAVNEEQDRCRGAARDMKVHQSSMKQDADTALSLESQEALLKTQVANAQAKTSALLQSHETKRQKVLQSIGSSRDQRQGLELQIAGTKRLQAHADAARLLWEQKISELRTEQTSAAHRLAMGCERLERQVQAYSTELFREMQVTQEALQCC